MNSKTHTILLFALATLLALAARASDTIPVGAFSDSTHHWYAVNRDTAPRVIQPIPNQPTYKPSQIKEIADNLLLFQRANGAWPKNYDFLAILTPEQIAAVKATRNEDDTTIDNYNTHSQITYLARAYNKLHDKRYLDAAQRGFDAILTAQLPCGGFPQIWPHPKGYSAYLTFNDGVTIGMLTLIRDVAQARPGFEWFSPDRRKKAAAALARGIECLLATQYTNKKGELQGWAQQCDPVTLKPAKARNHEMPALCALDTAQIIQFLMGVENPDPRVIRSIKAGAAWLDKNRIKGIRIEKAPTAETYRGADRHVVKDPAAPDIWARLYELETDRPMFVNNESKVFYELAQVKDRRAGYGWYTYVPADILANDYPAWLKKIKH